MDMKVADTETGGDSADANASDGYDDSGKCTNSSEEVAAPVSEQIEEKAKAT